MIKQLLAEESLEDAFEIGFDELIGVILCSQKVECG
jgi:phosphatidylglycerophosphatase A